MMNPIFSNPKVRPARQAGRFYDADATRLRQHIERMMAEAPAVALPELPRALLAPHAGYLYSGHVAAAAYRQIMGRPIDHILLLAPSHYLDFNGAALPSAEAFATPLGNVRIDREAVASLAQAPGFTILDEAHDAEHALEVQLPFLQVALGHPFEMLPLALGGLPSGGGAEALAGPLLELLHARAGQGQAWLILASSDTYHGYDPAACEANDARLAELIERLVPAEIGKALRSRAVMACGGTALTLAATLARELGARRGQVLKRSDSRGGSGPVGDYVVGYLAAAFV